MKTDHLSQVRQRWLMVALGLGGLLTSTAPDAQTVCRSTADQQRAGALYQQARNQSGEAALTLLRQSISACAVFQNQYLLADTLLKLSRFDEAEAAANDAIRLAPVNTDHALKGLVLLAEALRRQGKLGEAKELYEDAIKRFRQQNQTPPDWFIRHYVAFENAVNADGPVAAREIARALTSGGKCTAAVPRIGLRVEFEYDKATPTAQGQAQLKEVATAMMDAAIRSYTFKVIGHTDERGSDDYNRTLSEQRAQATVAELTRLQPDLAPRLQKIEGRGEQEPRVRNAATEEQHAVNRRVEFEALDASTCG